MEELLVQQKVAIYSIERALDNFKKVGKGNLTYGVVRHRLQQLKETFSKCEMLHGKIMAIATKDLLATEKYFTEDHFAACESSYWTASDYMAEWLSRLETNRETSPESSPVSHRQHSFASRATYQLPRINLPKFSGDFNEWEAFRDQFKSLIIDNDDLVDVNRLQYLNSCVKGEAHDIIRNLALTDANFKVAWNLLIDRYNNHRRLVHEHIHALHTLPLAEKESATALSALRDKANIAIQALRNLGRSVDTWDDLLIYLLIQKLDKNTRKAWELQLGDTAECPSYKQLEQFIASRIRALENILPTTETSKNKKQNSASVQSHMTNMSSTKCPVCQKPHLLFACPQFREKACDQRRALVVKFRRCFNCLSAKHTRQKCLSKHTCRQCQQKHHTLLHDSFKDPNNNAFPIESSPSSSDAKSENAETLNSHLLSKISFSKSRVLLATAWIKVSSPNGRTEVVRALLDQGSVTTIITERLAQRLRLARNRVSVSITGIGETAAAAKYAANLTVSSRDGTGPSLSVTALVLRSLTKYVPQRVSNLTNLDYLRSLNLADCNPTSSDPIDIILGADLYGLILKPGVRSRSSNEPVAQNSIFGWILSGPMPVQASFSTSIKMHHCMVHEDLNSQLTRFWEIEEIPQSTMLSPEEVRCEQHFASTYSRAPNGQYIVRLPFKTEPPLQLGESRPLALARYLGSEAGLKGHPEKAEEYREFLSEYESLGHMTKTQPSEKLDKQVVYIPHHAVIREHSLTTHLRVVFNASQPTSNGLSLNDHLMVGPKLQADLPSILLRWRQYRFVYTADIAKMYRQILVDKRDVDYQRILWRPTPDSSIEDYRLLTVTYGTASAPYQALRVLQQVTQDEGADFPLAVPVIRQNTYVDDCVFGADDVPLALQTRDQLISMLSRAGFKLRKWTTNTASLLSGIDPQDHGLAQQKCLQPDDHVKVLGIKWNPLEDSFQFEVSTSNPIPQTKRAILSMIARIYDPLGWLTPVVVTAKIFMQRLWLLQCGWDDVIPYDVFVKWQDYYKELTLLCNLSSPRWTGSGSDTLSTEIHGFADASTSAYGAVVYLRIVKMDGSIQVTMLMAKSKVAPLKPLSIPRLELCAIVLLARTIAFVRSALELSNLQCHCWTDSTVALAWLSQSPSHWKTFVANRVHDVQTKLPDAVWRHVSTSQNPADLASRGVNPSKFLEQKLWWEGPSWLHLSPDQWPKTTASSSIDSLPESRVKIPVHFAQPTSEWNLSKRFSSWTKLLRVTAYVIRFTQKSRRNHLSEAYKDNEQTEQLSLHPDEIKFAQNFWLKTVQRQLFAKEYEQLKTSHSVMKGSKLSSLNPFLDETGLIRVGGRLRHSMLPEKTKYPILLASHPLVSLLIEYTHVNALHAGPQLTLHLLREEFWILRSRQTIRATLYRCVKCARERASTPHELMGNLPACRVHPSNRVFTHCGIDYAGPIQIRSTPGRGHKSRKAYIAVFVCMTVKAVHLEVVSDCSTPAFIAAFDRFCARRGLPSQVYSDNATNFQGARNELAATWRAAIRDPNVINQLSEKGIEWKFIPPFAPHFGGLWEACVRSVKYHLKRVIGAHTLTFEEMSTLLCRIESCLNSRPIAPMSDNYDDYHALTPNHFLIGSATTSVPTPSLLTEKETRLTRWQLLCQLRDSFWKTWSNDYLQTLQQRPKWRSIQALAQKGRLVLLRNALLPPCNWELGRIIECHPGDDGLTRVVTVKTARSTYKRAIVKLCFLPVEINEDQALSESDSDHSVNKS